MRCETALAPRKRPLATGKRQNYCATPLFAKKVHNEEIEQLYSSLQATGKCSLLCETFVGNSFEPSSMFETSCTPKHQEVPILQPVSNVSRNTLFEKLPTREVVLGISSQTLQQINERVGVTPGEAVAIEEATR